MIDERQNPKMWSMIWRPLSPLWGINSYMPKILTITGTTMLLIIDYEHDNEVAKIMNCFLVEIYI